MNPQDNITMGSEELKTAMMLLPGSAIKDVNGNTIMSAASDTGAVKLSRTSMAAPELIIYQETVTVAQFTDGGATSGTLALSTTIPAGAVFARSTIHSITGFTGDTSAVITIGDGSDVDRYNTGTPSVFATAAAGVDLGTASGTLWHSAAKTPTLTVTTGADFTSCKTAGAGIAVITLYYYRPV